MRNQSIRSDISDAYAETESRLTDTVKNEEGVSSKNTTRNELEDIARESKDQKFKAEDHGITTDSAINTEYMLKTGFKGRIYNCCDYCCISACSRNIQSH